MPAIEDGATVPEMTVSFNSRGKQTSNMFNFVPNLDWMNTN